MFFPSLFCGYSHRMKSVKFTTIKWIAGAAAAVFLVSACSRQEVSNPKWEQQTMGTLCHITLSGPVPEKKLNRLREKIDAELEKVNRLMSTWQPDTEISRFNAASSLDRFPVSPEFAAVVSRALEIAAATGGAFDPTVKPLVDHWGFGARADTQPLEQILQAVGWRNVRIENGALIKTNPDVQLDLSAIAKGYGTDAVAEVIRSSGFENFLVEIGGEIVASGQSPKKRTWIVGVETPQPNAEFGAQIFRTLELSRRAMATSGDYRNFRERSDGTLYSHIIDPATGLPAETDVASVSVLADFCMDADAAATALFVMGSEKGFQWLENHPEFDVLFILHATNQTFTARATKGFPEE
jgi:thiamine biosynthesis lipoprotein